MNSDDESSISTQEIISDMKELTKKIMFDGLIDQLRESTAKSEEKSPDRQNHVEFLLEMAELIQNRKFEEIEDAIKKELIIQFYFSKYGREATALNLIKRLQIYVEKNSDESVRYEKCVPSFSNGLPKLNVFRPVSSRNFDVESGGSSSGNSYGTVRRKPVEAESSSDDENVRQEEAMRLRRERVKLVQERVSKRRAEEELVVQSESASETVQAAKIITLQGSDSDTEEIYF